MISHSFQFSRKNATSSYQKNSSKEDFDLRRKIKVQ